MPGLDALARHHEVHLWYVLPEQVTDERLLAAYRALMSPDEQARNARFVFPKGRHEHLVTRALVRTTLSQYVPAVHPRDWAFATGPFGRPEIAGPACEPPLRFNLSHTDGLIACLVAVDREVGVDVEDATRAISDGLVIADRYFSASEVVELRSLPAAAQPSRFFDYWTLKEAYIKARGLGLQLPLDQFSFHLTTEDSGTTHPTDRPATEPQITISFGPQIDDDPESWQFALLRPTLRHRLAVAIRRRREPNLTIRLCPVVPPIPPVQ
jgi:4'-phosphopantetheinyl transferase